MLEKVILIYDLACKTGCKTGVGGPVFQIQSAAEPVLNLSKKANDVISAS